MLKCNPFMTDIFAMNNIDVCLTETNRREVLACLFTNNITNAQLYQQ